MFGLTNFPHRQRGSNPGPLAQEASALTTRLPRFDQTVLCTFHRFSVVVKTNINNLLRKVVRLYTGEIYIQKERKKERTQTPSYRFLATPTELGWEARKVGCVRNNLDNTLLDDNQGAPSDWRIIHLK